MTSKPIEIPRVEIAALLAHRRVSAWAPLFFALYFLITGLHAFHVVVGMTVLVVVGVLAYRGRYSAAYNVPVENAALYWHLVDLIWIFVFPLIYLI